MTVVFILQEKRLRGKNMEELKTFDDIEKDSENEFGRKHVDLVMEWLEKNVPFFASEAQLQMSFVAGAMELDVNRRFIFIPEYAVKRDKFNDEKCDKRDEIDLVIIDTKSQRENGDNKKTFIEFKHKTFGCDNHPLFLVPLSFKGFKIGDYAPTNMGAVDLGSYDCWSDIERLEYYKSKSVCQNAYFIFITNDQRYWDSKATKRTHKFCGFSIADGDRKQSGRIWKYTDESKNPVTRTLSENKSIGAGRIEHTPLYTKDYETAIDGSKIVFEKYGEPVAYAGKINSVDFRQYMKLVLDIK